MLNATVSNFPRSSTTDENVHRQEIPSSSKCEPTFVGEKVRSHIATTTTSRPVERPPDFLMVQNLDGQILASGTQLLI